MNAQWAAAGLGFDVSDRVAVLTLDRPARLNAIDRALARSLGEAVAEIENDPAIGAAILTGSGERAFCAGADLKAEKTDDDEGDDGWAGFVRASRSKPIIAAVNGLAVGGGLELALACDFIYAADTARLGFPEVAIGVAAGAGGMFRFPRAVGLARAKEYLLTGEFFSAAEGAEMGLVNRVFPADLLVTEARRAARVIASHAPLSVAWTMRVSTDTWSVDDTDAWALSDEASRELLSSADAAEGRLAFLEKRKPIWTGA